MNRESETVSEIGFRLRNIFYERGLPVSRAILTKADLIAIAISVGLFSFGFFRNEFSNGSKNRKLIGFIVFFLAISARLLRRIFWGVRTESILIVKTLGLQKTTVYHSNFKSSEFIPWHAINDVIINEAIVMRCKKLNWAPNKSNSGIFLGDMPPH